MSLSKTKTKNQTLHRRDLHGGPVTKTPCLNAWDLDLIPRWGGSPGRQKWQPASVFLPGESRGQRSLAGYIHGIRESDRTEAAEHARTQETGFQLLEMQDLTCCNEKKQDATTKTEDPTGCN